MKTASAWRPFPNVAIDRTLRSRFGAELVEGPDQFAGDLLGGRLFDYKALHQVNQLAVAQDCDGGRGGRIALEIGSSALCGFAVLTGENGDLAIGLIWRVGESQPHSRPHLAGGTAADRVDYQESRSGLCKCSVDLFCSACLIDARAHQFLTHRDDHQFWIHVTSGKGTLCLLPFYRKLADSTGVGLEQCASKKTGNLRR